MTYTPRQLHAYVFLAEKRRQRELSSALHLQALAARADEQAIRNQLREWNE